MIYPSQTQRSRSACDLAKILELRKGTWSEKHEQSCGQTYREKRVLSAQFQKNGLHAFWSHEKGYSSNISRCVGPDVLRQDGRVVKAQCLGYHRSAVSPEAWVQIPLLSFLFGSCARLSFSRQVLGEPHGTVAHVPGTCSHFFCRDLVY